MPIRFNNTNGFWKRVYAGETETVCLLKREDDQRAGIFRAIMVFGARWDQVFKTGEPIQGAMSSNHSRRIHLPREQLDAAGVAYINALDRFRDKEGRHWQPESTTLIHHKLFERVIIIHCLRVDPPGVSV